MTETLPARECPCRIQRTQVALQSNQPYVQNEVSDTVWLDKKIEEIRPYKLYTTLSERERERRSNELHEIQAVYTKTATALLRNSLNEPH